MTAPPVPAAPPRSRLPFTAIALTCCLAVYVVAAPLLLRGSAIGWQFIVTISVAGLAALTVLAALWRMRRARADAYLELARISAAATALSQDAEQQSAQMLRQSAEIAGLTQEAAACRNREQRLLAECAGLRDDIAKRLEAQARAAADAVRYTVHERIPAVLEGGTPPPAVTEGIDAELAELLDEAMASAIAWSGQQASVRSAVVALSRRVQASAHRIQEESALMADRHPGNPDVLEVSMRVDHAAAQQARTAQSVAVLLGEWPGQQWSQPLALVDVVRAAAGRITAYRRIEVAGDPDIAAAAPVVEPVIHLVAELLANATQSSPPSTQVPVTVRAVQRGAVIEIHDCGVGLDDYRLGQARAVATGEQRIGLAELGEFPQTGLAVVGQYVRRHGLRVDISESVYGGVRAVVGIPDELVETLAPAESASFPVAAIPESRTPEILPSPLPETPAPGTPAPETRLPRRRSPRHGDIIVQRPAGAAGADTADTADMADMADMADTTGSAGIADIAAQPSPEEAGAWMGAFLSAPVSAPADDPDAPSGSASGPDEPSGPDEARPGHDPDGNFDHESTQRREQG